jgi:hypothetical protein
LNRSGVPRGTLLDRFAGHDVEQVRAKAIIEHNRGSAAEVCQALRCATTSHRGRGHDTDVVPATMHKKPAARLYFISSRILEKERLASVAEIRFSVLLLSDFLSINLIVCQSSGPLSAVNFTKLKRSVAAAGAA